MEETNKAKRLSHLQESGNDRKVDTDTGTKEAWRKKLIYLLSKEEEEIEVAETPDEPAKSEVAKMSAKTAEGLTEDSDTTIKAIKNIKNFGGL